MKVQNITKRKQNTSNTIGSRSCAVVVQVTRSCGFIPALLESPRKDQTSKCDIWVPTECVNAFEPK